MLADMPKVDGPKLDGPRLDGPRGADARFLRVEIDVSGEVAPPGLNRRQGSLEWPRLARNADSAEGHDGPASAADHGGVEPLWESEGSGVVAACDPPQAPPSRAEIVRELHRRYHWRVFAFARRSAGPDVAEDISQEVFVRLLRVRNLERIQIGVSYLLRIADNLLRRRFEKCQRFRSYLERTRPVVGGAQGNEAEDPSGGDGSSVQAMAVSVLDADRLGRILECLTPEEQSAVRLIVIQGLGYQAAARSLGVPVSTINNWKHRGIAKLRQLIEPVSPPLAHVRQRSA